MELIPYNKGKSEFTRDVCVIEKFSIFNDNNYLPLEAYIIDNATAPIILGTDYLCPNGISTIRDFQPNYIKRGDAINNIISINSINANINNVNNDNMYNNNIMQTSDKDIVFGGIEKLELTYLTLNQRNALKELLKLNWKAFAANPDAPGYTNEIEMRIDTGNNKPVTSKNRIYFGNKLEALRKQTATLLKYGKIGYSRSEYNSQPLLVPKPSDEWRFCVDYRMLNSITKTEDYPSTNVTLALQQLRNCDWYSSLDLANAYMQIPINKHDRHKTAFSTPDGKFEWYYVPFGLKNAPALFNQYYSHVLSRIEPKPVNFFDDTVPATRGDFTSHLQYYNKYLQ